MLFILMFVFFFKDTATTDIYTYWHTLSLHDALPISCGGLRRPRRLAVPRRRAWPGGEGPVRGERATGRGGGEVPARLAGSGPSRWRRELRRQRLHRGRARRDRGRGAPAPGTGHRGLTRGRSLGRRRSKHRRPQPTG